MSAPRGVAAAAAAGVVNVLARRLRIEHPDMNRQQARAEARRILKRSALAAAAARVGRGKR